MSRATSGLVIADYDLPDARLTKSPRNDRIVFVPTQVMVVIGKGSDPGLEIQTETISADNVPILRRGTGGCAVVLSPKMIVVSFVFVQKRQRNSADYFRESNLAVIRALAKQGVTDLEHAGTSDIARHGKKIAGTAIYRNRERIFYHAVVNLAENPDLIERYLLHPPRTPEYRNERSHKDFVTSLAAEGFEIDVRRFERDIEQEFAEASRILGAADTHVTIRSERD